MRLQEYEKHFKAQLLENQKQIELVHELDLSLRNQLSTMNEDVAVIEKMIRASSRLQSEAIIAFNHCKGNIQAAANMLRKRYVDSRSPSAQTYIQLLNKHFPPSNVSTEAFFVGMANEKSYTIFNVLAFYSDYYDNAHLPKSIELEKKRKNKLNVWKKLVQCVTDLQNLTKGIDELHTINDEIQAALHPDPHAFLSSSISGGIPFAFPSQSSATLNVNSAIAQPAGTLYSHFRSNSVHRSNSLNLESSKFGDNASLSSKKTFSQFGNPILGTQNPPTSSTLNDASKEIVQTVVSEDPKIIRPDPAILLKAWSPETDAVKLDSISVYKKFWQQLCFVLAELRYFRILEATIRKELDAVLQSRETLQLFKTAC